MKSAFLILLAAAASAATTPLPNILFVLSDDHSAPHMGCYGDPNVVTPNFDRFATEAVRFKRAYTTAPQCAPSRKSILSGRSPVITLPKVATPLEVVAHSDMKGGK